MKAHKYGKTAGYKAEGSAVLPFFGNSAADRGFAVYQ